MDNLQILQNFLPRLNSLIKGELRLKGDSKFVTTDYICGFSSAHNISIEIGESSRLPFQLHFKIEYLGHTTLEKWCHPTNETLNNFLYILEDLIQSSERIKNQSKSFPKLTDEDNRDAKLRKLFEKNTYIPLIP